MAKATAHCKCEICGSEFEKVATKANRREADSWVEWAEKNVTVCPSCYGKQKRQDEKDAGLVAKVMVGSPYSEHDSIWVILFGDTYPIKDSLKAIGAIWTDEYPETDKAMGVVLFGLSMSRPMNRWAIRLDDLDKLPEKVKALANMGFNVEFPGEDVISAYRAVRAGVEERRAAKQAEKDAEEKKKRLEQQKALDELGPKPAYSDEIRTFFPVGTTWNRKFYGKPGKYRVYISGKEVIITDAQKAEMKKTLNERDMWEEKKKTILSQ